MNKNLLEELYLYQKLSTVDIAKKIGKYTSYVIYWLKKHNIPLRNKSYYKKNTFNDSYFSVPTIENCYWAGFIAADGCINNGKRHKNLTIKINKKDEDHLFLFGKFINYNGRYYYNKNCIIMVLYSKKLLKDLETNFNIIPKKSLIMEKPNITDKNQILSFIIGYIDGDGSIKFRNKKLSNDYCVRDFLLNILGSEEFLNWIANNIYQIFGEIGKINKTYSKIYKYELYGKAAFNVCKKMFEESDLKTFLTRKWSQIDKYENYFVNRKALENVDTDPNSKTS